MSRSQKEEMKSEGLRIQYDLLEALQARHKVWADDSSDPGIECVHLEIIELVRQMKQKHAIYLPGIVIQVRRKRSKWQTAHTITSAL